jgi:hypothetical protein
MRLVRAFLAAALVAWAPAGAAGVHARAPAGVHLSLGARDDEMIVTWATFAPLASPTVRLIWVNANRVDANSLNNVKSTRSVTRKIQDLYTKHGGEGGREASKEDRSS